MKYIEVKKNTSLHAAMNNYVDKQCFSIRMAIQEGLIKYGETDKAMKQFNENLKAEYGATYSDQVRFIRGVKTTVEYLHFEDDGEMVRFVMDWA